jgi:hypothetical protein
MNRAIMKFAAACSILSILMIACGPSDFEKQKLAFEQQKYNDEKAAKTEAARKEEEDKNEQKSKWMACRVAASSDYDDEFKLWGQPVPGKPGIRTGPANQLKDIKSELNRKNEQCDRNFPKGVSW